MLEMGIAVIVWVMAIASVMFLAAIVLALGIAVFDYAKDVEKEREDDE